LADEAFTRTLNEAAVADFFAFGEINGNKTLFKGVEVLPPASILTYDGKSATIEMYWSFCYKPDYGIGEDELAAELVDTFREAVEVRFNDGLSHGVLLSGGLDSRSVVAAASATVRRDIFTVTFGTPNCNDATIAEAVSRAAKTRHIFVPLNPVGALTPYPEQIVYLTDGMHTVHAGFVIPVYMQVRHQIAVLSEGLALDLLLGGSFLTNRIFKVKTESELAAILNARRLFDDNMLAQLFVDGYYSTIKSLPAQSVQSTLSQEEGHPANRFDAFMLSNRVRRYIFMGHSPITQNFTEVTVPTYDNHFVDVILRIPPELRFGHRIYMKFLKALSPELARLCYQHTMLPADAPLWLWKPALLYQKGRARTARLLFRLSRGRISIPNRHSFAPVDQWLRTNAKWRQFTRDTLLSPNACIREFCRQEFIQQLVEDHETGRAYHSGRINQLLTFELFLRMFVAGTLPPPKT
ncbi:MAG: hypothetical protein DRI39_07115, partial [Chloroflexi bacterium]